MKTQYELFPNLPLVRDPYSYWRRLQRYYRSWLWLRYIRPVTFQLADWTCQANKPGCNGRAEQCHHLTYLFWSRGMDRPGEHTIAVCNNCHRYIHSHPVMWPDAANDNEPQLKYEDEYKNDEDAA
jgi:hypothetical protein